MGLEAQQRALAAQFGVPEAMFVEGMRRGLQVSGDGTSLRPDPGGLGAEIYASLDEVNMFDLYREISCPLLLLNAVDPPGGHPAPLGLSWIVELSAAFRRGQTQDLEALARSQGNVTVKNHRRNAWSPLRTGRSNHDGDAGIPRWQSGQASALDIPLSIP